MKLTVTHSELVSVMSARTDLPITSVEVEGRYFEPGLNLNLMDFVSAVKKYRYKSDEKIAAIKAVRQLGSNLGFSISLADAKFFVESL